MFSQEQAAAIVWGRAVLPPFTELTPLSVLAVLVHLVLPGELACLKWGPAWDCRGQQVTHSALPLSLDPCSARSGDGEQAQVLGFPLPPGPTKLLFCLLTSVMLEIVGVKL